MMALIYHHLLPSIRRTSPGCRHRCYVDNSVEPLRLPACSRLTPMLDALTTSSSIRRPRCLPICLCSIRRWSQFIPFRIDPFAYLAGKDQWTILIGEWLICWMVPVVTSRCGILFPCEEGQGYMTWISDHVIRCCVDGHRPRPTLLRCPVIN